ncbi:MAG: transporter substrate-binding protein [Mesorhizobium sp.]|nr:transporter substrate-binding protein [Mesorhizobium sp.]MBL8579121.1 transporter substrate-binding protein [Mesorhizobium sp.]
MKRQVEIGVLYSRSGTYPVVSEASRAGVLAAIADVNADPQMPIAFVPVEYDPAGNVDNYATGCADILANSKARHIIGCVTSWSRKEVIPVLEKTGGTLWYASPYEGFEANEHVVYMHACPNQHLVPLLGYVVPKFGANGYLVGSNYIWGWETNRVARDLIADARGDVLGERYLRLGETDVSHMIAEIEATRPSFILNNLIGPSSYAFIKAYAELASRDERFGPEQCPILSCNLTEAELPVIGAFAQGHLSAGPYFRRADAEGTSGMIGSSLAASNYAAVQVLARVLAINPEATFAELPAIFAREQFDTPFGRIAIDPRTQHATVPVEIGRVSGEGFEVVQRTEAVAPDPYLSRYDRTETFGRPRLKVVS